MSKKLLFIYRILFLIVACTWLVPDIFKDQDWALPFNEFWNVEKHYLALIGWTIFDLGCSVGASWQKRQQRKYCTLRHIDDPKRHNFTGIQQSSNKAVENYKDGVIQELNQEIKK